MSTKEKWIVYGIGFLLGCIFLSVIHRMKSSLTEEEEQLPETPRHIEDAK